MCQPLRIFGGLSLPLLLFLSLFLSVAETKLIKRPTAVRPRAISDGHSIFERLCDRIPNLFEYPSNSKKKKKRKEKIIDDLWSINSRKPQNVGIFT